MKKIRESKRKSDEVNTKVKKINTVNIENKRKGLTKMMKNK